MSGGVTGPGRGFLEGPSGGAQCPPGAARSTSGLNGGLKEGEVGGGELRRGGGVTLKSKV